MKGPRFSSPKLIRSATGLLVAIVLSSSLSLVSAQTEPSPSPIQPGADRSDLSAQELIGQQLTDSQIDYPTSLVYRAYALFGDPRLPADLVGNAPVGEDRALFGEVKRSWPNLPSETRDALTPFVVRPNDSRSIFFPVKPEAAPTNPGTQPTFAAGDCQDGWVSKASQAFEFKVWTHCAGDYNGDLSTAISLIDDFWKREVAMMGPPIPDTGSAEQGGDSKIDIYFVDDENDIVNRRGGDVIQAQALAHAAPDDPVVGKGSSGYIVARRPDIGDPSMTLVLAHEFYHILQQAHNWEISFGFKGTPYSQDFEILDFSEYWFTEATATWVMSYLYRDTIDPEIMRDLVHARYFKHFAGSEVPLNYSPRPWSRDFGHIYAAYIYFLFLEQEVGPQPISDIWKKLETVNVDDFEATTRIINDILPFKEHFRDFAVRNLNLDLSPGNPISPRYIDLDPSFPDNERPTFHFAGGVDGQLPAQNPGDDPLLFPENLRSLVAHYYQFAPGADVQKLTIDFGGLLPSNAFDVDLIVKVRDGNWERRQLDSLDPTIFCFNKASENVEQFYLILTNHDMNESTTVTGSFSVQASNETCA